MNAMKRHQESLWVQSKSHYPESQSSTHNNSMLLLSLAALILSSVMIVAGLKMKRLEAYGLAVTGSILAILVTPGNVIGSLPPIGDSPASAFTTDRSGRS